MQNFLFIYRNPQSDESYAPSPEEMQQMMAQWNAWKEQFPQAIKDMGDGLLPEGRVMTADGVTDGPFIESKEVLGGFSIIQAEDFDAALEVAKHCPMTFVPGFSIEIRAFAGY